MVRLHGAARHPAALRYIGTLSHCIAPNRSVMFDIAKAYHRPDVGKDSDFRA
jgi:hypothetical protein